MLKGKKAMQVLETVLRLLVAVAIIVLIVLPFGGKLYAAVVGGVGDSSFKELLKSMDEAADGETNPMVLSMDPGTALIGFNKKEKNIEGADKEVKGILVKYNSGYPSGYVYRVFKKPTICENGKTCICLCKRLKLDESKEAFIKGNINSYPYECDEKKSNCYSKDFDIPEMYKQCSDKLKDNCISSAEGGFIFARNLKYPEYGSMQEWAAMPQGREIYVEKYKDTISVCESKTQDGSCLEEDQKKQIDARTAVLSELKTKIEGCRERKMPNSEDKCSCGNFELGKLPDGYGMKFKNEGEKTSIMVYDKGNKEAAKDEFQNMLAFYDVDNDKDGVIPELDVANAADKETYFFTSNQKPTLVFIKKAVNGREIIVLGKHDQGKTWSITPIQYTINNKDGSKKILKCE